MTIYQKIAETLQYVTPKFYKERYFKRLKNLSSDHITRYNLEPELLWVKKSLSENAVFIDVGCNVGSYLYLVEQQLSPKNIFGFEPNPTLFSRLKRIFPELQIFPFALSDRNEIAVFKIPVIDGETLASRGTLQIDFQEENEENHFTEQVKVIPLDDWKELEKMQRIDFIKIDVEGNEMKTLHGAKKTIQKFQPTLMVEMEQRHHQKPLQEMISEIESWNYTAHFLNRENFQLEKIDQNFYERQLGNAIKNKNLYINNIIFIPNTLKTS